MAWTTPLTAVSNAALTAAQWNASVRDNLLQTAPALATTAGSFFATTAANTIAERVANGSTIGTSETTTSTAYTDLATVGPGYATNTGPRTFVFLTCQLTNGTATIGSFLSFAVTSATSVSATDASALVYYPSTAGNPIQATRVVAQGVSPGSNNFTLKYRVAAASTGTFSQRNVSVIPF